MTLALLLAPLALAADLPLYEQAVHLIEGQYLRLEAVDPRAAFLGAADAAEGSVPWLIVEPLGEGVQLRHGASGPFARLERPPATLAELPAALGALEDAILGEGTALPEAVELSVELLRGATSALDRPSVVLAGEKLTRFDERIRGTTSGVGARIGLVGGELTIKSLFDDGPAERAGLRVGDVIVRVDGLSTLGMTVSRAVDHIRGPEGSSVTLLVRRVEGGAPRELSFVLQRAELVLPNVEWERQGALGWMRLDHFSDHTESLMRRGLEELAAEGPLDGLILDLRGNAGGSMIQAARAADLFLDQGLLVRTVGRGGAPVDGLLHEISARPGASALPLVVLVDQDSASASEILAGALQSHGRAVLLGDRTYGKGTVQKIFTLRAGEDPVRLKLTVAEYRLVGDVPVAEVGLAPDLWARTASFSAGGVSLPEEGPPGERSVLFVDEQPGWREGVTPPHRDDPLRDLAAELLRTTEGPGAEAMRAALERVLAEARQEEDRRLVEAFSARGLDWGAGAAPAAPLAVYEVGEAPVSVELGFEDPPVPGSKVRVFARVRATRPEEIRRARIRLSTPRGDLPWDDVILPIGHLKPGEEREVWATVAIPLGSARREDVIALTYESEGAPARSLGSRVVEIGERAEPRVRTTAKLAPDADHQVVLLTVENRGPGTLTGLRARLRWPEAAGVELLAREAGLPALGAGERGELRLPVRVSEAVIGPLALELLLDAEQLVDPLVLPLALGRDGRATVVEPPELTLDAPLSALPGPLTVLVEARDDQGLADLTLWQGGEKVAWSTGGGRRLRLEVPLTLPEGSVVLVARTHDWEGAEAETRLMIRGVPGGDGAAQRSGD